MPSKFHVKNAELYESLMGRFSSLLAPPFLDWLKTDIGGNILDVGCGTGSLIGELLQRNAAAKITAIDYEERFVAYSQKKFDGETRVSITQGDAETLTFEDGAFDHSLTMLTLHFVSEPVKALKEMKRVTRKGGIIAGTVWRAGNVSIHEKFWQLAAEIDPYAASLREKNRGNKMMEMPTLQAAFRNAGLSGVTGTEIPVQMGYDSFAHYWEPHAKDDAKTNKFLGNFAPGNVKKLEEALREAYLAGMPDGPRSYPAMALAVKAVH